MHDIASTIEDKRIAFMSMIAGKPRVILEIGCGNNKPFPDAIGIDRLKLQGVDIVHDLESGLEFIPDNTVDEISSSHVLEHITDLELLMKEVHRVLKKDGIHKVTVPHFSSPHYYSDFTHKRFFGLYTFDYFSKLSDQSLKRTVPDFYVSFHFKVTRRQLNFKTNLSPRNILNIVFASPVFNASNYMKELYEDKFSWMFPCREIYYEMTPVKD